MRRAHVPSIALAALTTLAACDSCHGKKPYTPYTITDTPTATSSAAARPDAGDVDGGAFAVVAATPAPGDGTSWSLEGGAVAAPTGHPFSQGLVVDADGDGTPDLLAWARAPNGLRGELWFASGKAPGEGRAIAPLPADLSAPGCTATATLSQIAKNLAVLDFEPRCPVKIREKATRWIAIVRLGVATPEIALELKIGAAAEGEALAVALDGKDRDADGRGDVTITFTLTGAPRPLPTGGSASASIAFFDRPAGLSRDPTEPDASLKTLDAALVADGRKRTTALQVPAAAITARRLHTLLCDEGHRAIDTSAGPARCGELRLVEDSTIAEIEAALNLREPIAAMAALARFDSLGHRRKDVDSLVARSIPTIRGTLARTTAAIPESVAPAAGSPLAFDPGGDLLVRTKDGAVRVDRTSFAESPVDPGLIWQRRIAWPPGDAPRWTLVGVEQRCGEPTLMGRFEIGAETTTAPLPIPTPPRCTPIQSLRVDALGTSSQGLLFAVRGDVVALAKEDTPKPAMVEGFSMPPPIDRGVARSPNGGTIALAGPRGVLVAVLTGSDRRASAKLWAAPIIDGASACVPSDAGERLACVVAQGAAIYDAR
jgi:hypothetical protein